MDFTRITRISVTVDLKKFNNSENVCISSNHLIPKRAPENSQLLVRGEDIRSLLRSNLSPLLSASKAWSVLVILLFPRDVSTTNKH